VTWQIQDDFRYRGEEYTLAAWSAGEPFSPARLGIRPNMASTACWRGYLSTYGLRNDQLVVAELRLQLVEDEVDWVRVPGPEINGVAPLEHAPGSDGFNNNYLGLDLPVDYDGGLIIGRDYLEHYHSDLDLITLWKYREILELRFGRGRLTEVRDISAAVTSIQEFADEQRALLDRFMRDRADAMRAAGSQEERRAIRSAYFDPGEESVFGAEIDDVARERLSGVLDPGYLDDSTTAPNFRS